MKDSYDFLIVGAGLYGSVCARELSDAGYSCLIIDKRSHIAGNCYLKEDESGIKIHRYGAHIFHTNNERVNTYVNKYAYNFDIIPFINTPIANYKGKLYNLPFNMNTFTKIFGEVSPDEVKSIIAKEIKESGIDTSKIYNLEEKAISMVGTTIYNILIKEYTEKQWGRPCKELDKSIINRLPLRFIFNNNYFTDKYQYIFDYTKFVSNLLQGYNIDISLNTKYHDVINKFNYKHIIYTGSIDELYGYSFGHLEYRGLRFEDKIVLNTNNYQGTPVMNFTSNEVPYTRVIEHSLFEYDKISNYDHTILSYEFPLEASESVEPYYPINNYWNLEMYSKYLNYCKSHDKIYLGGRLAEYKYYDMDDTIDSALNLIDKIKDDLRIERRYR